MLFAKEIALTAASPVPKPAISAALKIPVSVVLTPAGSLEAASSTEKCTLYIAKPVPLVLPLAIGSIYADKSSCALPPPAVAFVMARPLRTDYDDNGYS